MNYCSQEDNIGYQEVKHYKTPVFNLKRIYFLLATLYLILQHLPTYI